MRAGRWMGAVTTRGREGFVEHRRAGVAAHVSRLHRRTMPVLRRDRGRHLREVSGQRGTISRWWSGGWARRQPIDDQLGNGRRLVWVVVSVAVACVGLGCTRGEGGQGSHDSEMSSSTAPSGSMVLSQVGDRLPLSGPEGDCLERRVDQDVALRERAGLVVPAPGSEEFAQLERYVESCTNEVTFAVAFVELERRKYGALTPEQEACLRDGFVGLPPAEIDRLVSEGLGADVSNVSVIEESCGLDQSESRGA